MKRCGFRLLLIALKLLGMVLLVGGQETLSDAFPEWKLIGEKKKTISEESFLNAATEDPWLARYSKDADTISTASLSFAPTVARFNLQAIRPSVPTVREVADLSERAPPA